MRLRVKSASARPQTRQVVVVAKAPEAGRVKTRLCPPLSPEEAARLAAAFLSDSLTVAATPTLRARTALALDGTMAQPPAVVPVTQQRGNSLGERIVHIFENGFCEGFQAVCVIGSDAPHLPAAFLIEAFGRLERGADVVLGPADDGGYYLTALSRPLPTLFEQIPWSGPDVLAATRARASAAGLSVSLLPPWYDVDTPSDLRRLREDLRRGVVHAPATEGALAALAWDWTGRKNKHNRKFHHAT